MKIKSLLFPISLLGLLVAPLSLSSKNEARALLGEENNVVSVGDIIEVESRSLVYNGQTKVSGGQIVFPDGTSKSGKNFTISMPGVYKVIYSALFGTHEVSETVYYNCYRRSSDFFLSSNKKNQPVNGEYSFNTKTSNVKGARLTLDSTTTFTYDGIIDFTTYNPNQSFVEILVDTSKQGESDLGAYIVRLTDINDELNYVDIQVTDSGPLDDDGQGCYILSGANGQFKVGFEGSTKWINAFGANVGSSFRGLPSSNPAKPAKLYFNYAEKALYVSPKVWSANDKILITDLDSAEIYKSTVWGGFSEGKAKLSIFASSLINPSATIVVSSVAGIDLSQYVFKDEVAPEIEIDYGNQSPYMLPQATVGKPYKLFNAIIKDNYDRDLSYSASVIYKDIEHSKDKDVSIINGEFFPSKPGTYEITYTAKDYSNNINTKTINVVAINDAQTMTMTVDPTSMSQVVYSDFVLPSVNDVVISGGSGNPTVTRRIVDASGNEYKIDGDVFVPQEPGTYRVFYSAHDYIGNVANATLTLTAEETTAPIFIGELNLPRVLVKGHSYSLPMYQGLETINGKSVYLTSSIYVNGQLLSDDGFIAGDNCNVTYKVKGQTGQNEYNVSIPVINGDNEKDQAAYFYGNYDSVVENYSDVTLTTNHDASAVFASILPYDNPTIGFEKEPGTIKYDYLLFKYSDHLDPNITLTFKVKFSGDVALISLLNSSVSYDFSYELYNGKEIYSINFINSSRTLLDINQNELVRVDYDDNGNPFNGFKHGLYLDISMVGVSDTSSLIITSICNQDMGHSDLYLDLSAPIIIFPTSLVNEQEFGSEAIIPAVEAFDILGDVSVTVSVKGPDGKFKLSNVDARVDHKITLDSFGSYVVTYRGVDNSGNFSSYPRRITVFDNVPPTLTVDYNLKDSYKLNSEIKIPNYSASDNLGQYTVNVLLLLPNDEIRLLLLDKNGTVTSYLSSESSLYNSSFRVNASTFRAEQYGTYKLRYIAYDEAFNKVVKEFTFVVK